MADYMLYGDVQMTPKEYEVIKAVENRGVCPYCGKIGLSNSWGSKRKHIRACGDRLTSLGKEKEFAKWVQEAKETGRV
jgi:hypothetical protein